MRAASLTILSELCSTNAALFASKPMRFLALDQITFRLPVPIGAVLLLTSKIVKTTRPTQGAISDEEAKVHIMVRAEVEDVKTGVSVSFDGILQLYIALIIRAPTAEGGD
jgi:acyl-CoA hydrolase